jgi:hypothetical protein
MARALRVELELPDDAFGEDFDQETFCAKVREAAVMRLLREHRIFLDSVPGLGIVCARQPE